MGAQHFPKLPTGGAVAGRRCGGGVEPVGCVAQRLEVDAALVPEIVEQQTLGNTSGLGDVAGRDVVKVVGGEVLNSGVEKLAPGQFSLGLTLRLAAQAGGAGSHLSIVRQ